MQASGARAWTTLSVLRKVLDDCLRLLHPYIPYVTEETWQQLKAAFVAADLGHRASRRVGRSADHRRLAHRWRKIYRGCRRL
ncbi:MAG: class I tRNA ligase family protein [Chloroflexi bacterium]|nr:class I tRNA ligase family protein [Chloroflexota bacterium]